MSRGKKRPGKTGAPAVETPMQEVFPLPESVILTEILRRLNLESLCTLACVCRGFHSMVSQAIGNLTSLDLSGFSVNEELLDHIIPRLKEVKIVTVNCLHLGIYNILRILEPCIQELSLLKCVSLPHCVLPSIGQKCPNLRILVLELVTESSPETLRTYLIEMVKKLSYLEDLSIKICGKESDTCHLAEIDLCLPRSVKSLRLQSVTEEHAIEFIEKLRCETDISGAPLSLGFTGAKLLRLSLVLNIISDRLMFTIAGSLPRLAELHLEDRPSSEPNMPHDLTNEGIHRLSSCQHLKHLSIVRSSRLNYPSSFKRVDDDGLLLLSQSSGGLESVKLGGFSQVTDVGFSSLLRACPNLNKFEVLDALLSDLAFRDTITCLPLVELTLESCNFIASEATELDIYGRRSVANSCLKSLSPLTTLTSLNLGGSDVTNDGLLVLSQANLPLTSLCLKGCARISDQGIFTLFKGPKRINKTLSSLDIGSMRGISDCAIISIISNAEAISELSIRHCSQLTDFAFVALASGRSSNKSCQIRKLDVASCMGFSDELIELLRTPRSLAFRGLRWLGIRGTLLAKASGFGSACRARPWLTLCSAGCEIGCCDDKWYIHRVPL